MAKAAAGTIFAVIDRKPVIDSLSEEGMKILKWLKFIYSMKATKFCAISTLDLTVTAKDKYMVEVLQKFVAFSEYMNSNK